MNEYEYVDEGDSEVAVRPASTRTNTAWVTGASGVLIPASEAPKLCKAIYKACGLEWIEPTKELPTAVGSIIRAHHVRGEHSGDGWLLYLDDCTYWQRLGGGIIANYGAHRPSDIGPDWTLMQITEAEG